MDVEVKGGTLENEIPEEFQNIDNDNEYIWAYQRFEEFVDNNVDLIRSTLNQPKMIREDMLDAIYFGDFRRHKEKCLKWEPNGKIPKWKNKKTASIKTKKFMD